MKQDTNIRLAKPEDLNAILSIFASARKRMIASGNPQWQNGRPDPLLAVNDIKNGYSYVLEDRDGIFAVFSFIEGDDPTYTSIDGKWLNDEPYAVIHRVASSGHIKGVLDMILDHCELRCSNLRIDTHEKNLPMKHILEKRGYTRCGIIIVDDGTEREAYQKVVKKLLVIE